jgi:general secretion pathway protein B
MSFILDALKKSENDRQRQSGPALFEVRVPPPRSRFPLLAVAIVSLLVVNLGLVAWLIFRKPADAAVPQVQQVPAPQPQAAPPQVAQTLPPPAMPGAPQPAPGYPSAPAGYYAQPQGAPPPGYAQQPNYGQQPSYGQQLNAPPPAAYGNPPVYNAYPPQEQQYAAGSYPPPASVPESRLPEAPEFDEGNPDDYAPAQPPGLAGLAARATRATESGLPTYEQASSKVALPQLHMDLHSYAPDPAKRFVLVNMRRLHEGQATPEGVKVETITTDAAILSYQGTRFVLNRQ